MINWNKSTNAFKSSSRAARKFGLDISYPIESYPSTKPKPIWPGKNLLFINDTYSLSLIVSICSAWVASVPNYILKIYWQIYFSVKWF